MATTKKTKSEAVAAKVVKGAIAAHNANIKGKGFSPAVAAKQSKQPVDKGVKDMKAIAVKADNPVKVEFPARTDACGSVAKLLKTLSMAPRGAQFYTSNSTMIVENSKGRELGRIYL